MKCTRSKELHQIRDQDDLATCWFWTNQELEQARKPGSECSYLLPEWDHKLATLTRWLLACFEASPSVASIEVDGNDTFVLTPGNGEILISRPYSPYGLNFVPLPCEPDCHPRETNVQPVTMPEFNFMDE